MRAYELDASAAKKADTKFSKITETGKYVGAFVYAEAVVSEEGTEGVEFSFKDDSGASADFLQIWTHRADGSALAGNNVVSAIMACLRLRKLSPVRGRINKWVDGARRDVDATVFAELAGKRIGLLLQKEFYRKNNGDIGSSLRIYMPFEAGTGLVATEILAQKTTPEIMPKALETLKDKPAKGSGNGAQNSQRNHSANTGRPAPADEFDDDQIPF